MLAQSGSPARSFCAFSHAGSSSKWWHCRKVHVGITKLLHPDARYQGIDCSCRRVSRAVRAAAARRGAGVESDKSGGAAGLASRAVHAANKAPALRPGLSDTEQLPAMTVAGSDNRLGPATANTTRETVVAPQVPSLDAPCTLALSIVDDAIVDEFGNALLEGLPACVTLNERASPFRGLVLGAANEAGPAHCWDVVVGQLHFKRFLACARNKLWWMTPEWGSSLRALPPETQFLLLELDEQQQRQQQQQGSVDVSPPLLPNGMASAAGKNDHPARYAVVLPLIDGDFRGTLRPSRQWTDKEKSLVLRIESGDQSKLGQSCDSVLLVAAGTDPFHLVDAAVAAAAALSGGAAPRAAKQLPASLDGFGWCTWDAFYSTVSARGLVEGLESLADGGVTPQLLIIDDGWQLTDVDPAYGKAPTAALAETLAAEGMPAAELLDSTKEMVITTQDTYYEENAKLLAEASGQMQQEVRNLFPTVANTGAIGHHHAPPPPPAAWAETIDSSADEEDSGSAAAAAAAGGGGGGPATTSGAQGNRTTAAAAVSSRPADALAPDWAQQRGAPPRATQSPNLVPGGVEKQQQQQQLGQENGNGLPGAEEAGGILAAAAQAEARLEAAAAETQAALRRALRKAAPSPRRRFVLVRWAQRAAGWLAGLGTAAFLLFYQWLVEPAPPHSLRVRVFAAAAQSFLRGALLMFFASASDFTRRLTSVEANAKFARLGAGPEEDWEASRADLRTVVTHIKQTFGVRFVYCWHGLPAYWGGIMPESPELAGITDATLVYPKPTASIAEVEPSLLWSPAVLAGVGVAQDPGALYRAMHSYLADSAVDGVKVDCQAGVGLVGSVLGGGPAAARRFQAALEESIATHFPGNHAINCMCHSSENFYRFSATAVARVSDDYYPRDPASSTPHIGACAYNSLYLGGLVQPDWDMFQSAHPAGTLHAMARAVSGGAVYVSDKPGQHDFSLLRRLVLPGGHVLRALLPGRPTRDCLFADVLRDGKSLLKVWNANAVVGIVGIFNLQGSAWDRDRRKFHIHDAQPPSLSVRVQPGDVDSLPRGSRANSSPRSVMYRFTNGVMQLSGGDVQDHGGDGVEVALPPGGSELVWVSPLLTLPRGGDDGSATVNNSSSDNNAGSSGWLQFAPLGLADMFNGGGAVVSCSLMSAPSGGAANTSTSGATGSGRAPVVAAAVAANAANAAAAGGEPSTAVASLLVKGCGRFVAYCSERPARVLLNLTPHSFAWDQHTRCLELNLPDSVDLHTDLQLLWH